jgi:hypothetical protein
MDRAKHAYLLGTPLPRFRLPKKQFNGEAMSKEGAGFYLLVLIVLGALLIYSRLSLRNL